jgi:uroporphyrinogen-III synthase
VSIPKPRDPNSASPLAGLAVLVTRPVDQATALCARVIAAGARPLSLPLFSILPIEPDAVAGAVLDEVASADWIIFISTNAVRYGAPVLSPRWPCGRGPRILCIGRATRRCAEAFGLRPEPLPDLEEFSSEGLLRLPELQAAAVSRRRIIIVRGRGGRETLASCLRDRGARVDYLEVYHREAAELDLAAALVGDRPDLTVVTSVESLTRLATLAREQSQSWIFDVPIIAMSHRIAAAAADLGFSKPPRVAAEASDDGLFAAIEAAAGGSG